MQELPLLIATDHPAYAGHFPGQPLLPGVVLLAEVLQAVLADAGHAALLGPAPRLAMVKFLRPVRPGDVLRLRLQLQLQHAAGAQRLSFELRCAQHLVASGQFDATPPA